MTGGAGDGGEGGLGITYGGWNGVGGDGGLGGWAGLGKGGGGGLLGTCPGGHGGGIGGAGGDGGHGGGLGGGSGGGGDSAPMRSPHRQLAAHVLPAPSTPLAPKYFCSNAGTLVKNADERHGMGAPPSSLHDSWARHLRQTQPASRAKRSKTDASGELTGSAATQNATASASLEVQPQRKPLGKPQPRMRCSVLPSRSVGQHDIAVGIGVPTGWAWRRAGWAGLIQLACCDTQRRQQAQQLHCTLQAHGEGSGNPSCSTRRLTIRRGDDAEVQAGSCRYVALQRLRKSQHVRTCPLVHATAVPEAVPARLLSTCPSGAVAWSWVVRPPSGTVGQWYDKPDFHAMAPPLGWAVYGSAPGGEA
eukprot:364816-Chlamydomonas_euryale.AAC.7